MLDNCISQRKCGLFDVVDYGKSMDTLDADLKSNEVHFQSGDVKNDFGLISPDPDEQMKEDCIDEDMSDMSNSAEGEIESHSSKKLQKKLGLQERKGIFGGIGLQIKGDSLRHRGS